MLLAVRAVPHVNTSVPDRGVSSMLREGKYSSVFLPRFLNLTSFVQARLILLATIANAMQGKWSFNAA